MAETQQPPKVNGAQKPLSENLQQRLERLETFVKIVREAKSKPIVWTEPLIKHKDAPMLFPNSIMTIQGQSGTHKSRMGQNIASALISRIQNPSKTMGFEKVSTKEVVVAYIDTERNHQEQFAAAIQEILLNAGYSIEENPASLEYLPILMEERSLRLETLTGYIRTLRDKHLHKHIVLVLDVVPDFIGSFNDEKETYKLIDLLNKCINQFEVTFLCVIHENPGSEKARGHLGTELQNKSTTVLQIAALRNKQQDPTGTFKVKMKKQRSGALPLPFYVVYDDTIKNLRLEENVPTQDDENPDSIIRKALPKHLLKKLSKEKALGILSTATGLGKAGLEKRLNAMISTKECIETTYGDAELIRIKEGRQTYLKLKLHDLISEAAYGGDYKETSTDE